MDASEYQRLAETTAVYPGQGEALGLAYCIAGLAAGAGAVNNEAKKVIRDDGIAVTPERMARILHCLGENQWYGAQICTELGTDLSYVLTSNIEMLADRARRGVIHGDGPDR